MPACVEFKITLIFWKTKSPFACHKGIWGRVLGTVSLVLNVTTRSRQNHDTVILPPGQEPSVSI